MNGGVTQQPAHEVGAVVFIKPVAERRTHFALPGDDDNASDVHGHLQVRSVNRAGECWWPAVFMYTLAPDSRTSAVYMVPDHGVEAL